MARRKREREIIGRAIELLSRRNGWTTGSWEYQGSYCLVGAINRAQHVSARTNAVWTRSVLWELGFDTLDDAIGFNDRQVSSGPVLARLRETHWRLDPWRRLHEALDESRVAHAEREIGRGVPDGVPAAWVEEREQEREKALA